jgi:hypothetical protein
MWSRSGLRRMGTPSNGHPDDRDKTADPDIRDPDFPAQCTAWTAPIRSEIQEILAVTRRIIEESWALLKGADRMLGGQKPGRKARRQCALLAPDHASPLVGSMAATAPHELTLTFTQQCR